MHTKHVPLAADVDLDLVATETPGLVGAELRNLVNEAALLAAKKGRDQVQRDDFAEALEKISLGPARHVLLNPIERQRTAYHESGHALLGLLVPGSDPVHRVTIVPRGMSLGATYQLPPTIGPTTPSGTCAPASSVRSAVERLNNSSTAWSRVGAESDLQQVSAIARQMVVRWGMSDKLGPMSLVGIGGRGLHPIQSPSEATAELIDLEMRGIVEGCYREAVTLLSAHRHQLDALASALLQAESLDEADILRATGLQPRAQLDAD